MPDTPPFTPVPYTVVSFEALKNNPGKFSGVLIAIDGYLASDFGQLDTDKVPGLYDKEIDAKRGPDLKKEMIGIDSVYSYMLGRFGFNQRCRIYGVYYVPSSDLNLRNVLYSFIRIDRVEAAGRVLESGFNIKAKAAQAGSGRL